MGEREGGWQRRTPGSRSRTICGRSLNQTQEHLRQGTAVAEILTQHAFLCQKRGGSQIPILEGEIKSPSNWAERIPACLPNNIGRRPSPPLQIAERSQNSGKERILRVKLALSVRPSEFMRLHALSGRPFWSVGRSFRIGQSCSRKYRTHNCTFFITHTLHVLSK